MKNKKCILWVAVWAAVMIVSVLASADTVIGVNFVSCWPNTAMSGKTFDGLSNWTDSVPLYTSDAAAASGTGLVVLGSKSFITCDWSSSNVYYGGSENNWDQQLYRGYLDDGGSGYQVTISGLSAWRVSEGLKSYTIRIYQNSDNATGFMPVDIKSGEMILETIQSTNSWTTDGGRRANVDTNPLTADTIILKSQPRSGSTRGTISGFKITGIVDEFIAQNPVPADGDQVILNQVLSWQQDAEVSGLGLSYNVYFGIDANTFSPTYYGLTPVKTTTADPADFNYDPDLANSMTYYWRVDTIEPNVPNAVVYTGVEWWFTTVPPSAFVTLDPVSQTVPAGSTVQLTVAGENIETYQWFKDTVLMEGETAATLTIENAQVADEGYYHCEVDNSLIQPDASAAAQVMTERLVGWWKLNGDLTDSVALAVAGAPTHDGTSVDPNFVGVGKDGGALQFYGDVDGLVIMSDSADFYNFYPRGYAVSAWVNMPVKVNSPWGAYICKQGTSPDRGFILTHQGAGQAVHTLRQSFNDMYSDTDVDDDNWHLVVGTYDGATKQGKVYVDGVLKNQATSTGNPAGSPADLIFGAENLTATTAAYVGQLDDVRIWSYPIDAQTVANLYTDFNPGVSVCIENPALDTTGPDGVPDCKVDLYELARIAKSWIECGRWPESYCD